MEKIADWLKWKDDNDNEYRSKNILSNIVITIKTKQVKFCSPPSDFNL